MDFEPYLKAVSDASARARSTLYVVVVALIAIFAAHRNTLNPDWLDTRLQQLQIAHACLTGDGAGDARCADAIRYARQFVYTPAQRDPATPYARITEKFEIPAAGVTTPPDRPQMPDEAIRELRQSIDLLMRQRTENLSVRKDHDSWGSPNCLTR